MVNKNCLRQVQTKGHPGQQPRDPHLLFIVENFSGSSNISKAVVAAAAPGFSLLAPACLQFPQL